MKEVIKKYATNSTVLLVGILLIGFAFRIWGLGSAEIFHDEGLYAFRSIGYIDYIQNPDQTTPIQWFKDMPTLPWWTKLSFHDAPPLYFLTSHLFFKVFGDSLFVARLPSLIAGMFAIWLVFLIARRLFAGEYARSANNGSFGNHADLAGLLAALLLSINHIHIWISRTSIIESLLITMMLANIYFFLRFVEDKKWWFWFGLTFGLCFLTKYNAIVLVPIYVVYLIFYNRDYFRTRQLYYAAGITILIFSPVLIYNFYLYQTVHHFDLQFAYLFNQPTPEWRASLGKIQEPFSVFIPNMFAVYSKPFIAANILAIVWMLFSWKKSSKDQKKLYLFLLSGIVLVTVLLVKIGVGFRFLTLYIPFSIFLVVAMVPAFKSIIYRSLVMPSKTGTTLFSVAIIIFSLWEIWFSIGGIFLEFPHLGVVELDNYLAREIGSTRSPVLIKSPNLHLNAVIQRYYSNLPKGDKPVMIVYDENILVSPKLWLFARRLYYHGIPTITVGQFNGIIRTSGANYFKSYIVYFIRANENAVIINTNLFYSADAKNLEDFLKKEFNLSPAKTIYGSQPINGIFQKTPMFYVYKILF